MEKKGGLSNIVFYGVLACGLILFIAYMALTGPPSPTSSVSTPSGQSPSTSANNQGGQVVTSLDYRGEYLVVTTKLKNEKSYPIKQKLELSVTDSTGKKYFVDMVNVELNAGETGKSESSKKLSEVGPPPHKVVTEWK